MIDDKDDKERGDDWMNVFDTFHSLFRTAKKNQDMKAKNLIGFMGGGGSPVPVVYPSTDYAILSGAPNGGTALDYLAFVDSDITADGTRLLVYREGQNHNSTSADASIIFRKRPSGGVLSAPVTIATGDASTNVSDPSFGVTQTGRIIVFYSKKTGTPSQRSLHFKYSDDVGDTWSAEILFAADQASGQPFFEKQLDGPGRAIQYEGYMLKATYGTTTPGVGGRLGRLYKSTDDSATSWTFVANIWPSSVDDGEEPTLVALSSGRLIATQRSDTVDETRLLYSDDGGLTWSDPISIGFTSVGKSPITVSPSGTLFMMGRWFNNNGQPMFAYSNSPTGISGWSAPQAVSVRSSTWMYGGVVWDHIEEKFIANWAQGVPIEDTPGISGPTIIFEKEFIPSTTPIVAPPVYNYYYQNYIDYPQGLGVTVPAYGALTDLQNQLVQYLVDDGIWEELDKLNILQNNDATLSTLALYNWVEPSRFLTTAINNPTYGVNGYSFVSGSSQYLDLNWHPSEGVNYQRDNASAFAWLHSDGGASSGRALAASNANASTMTAGPNICPRNASDQFVWQINDDTNSTISGITDGAGFKFINRTDSSTKKAWNDGLEIGSATVVSVARTVVDVGIGGVIFVNGPGFYRTCTVSILGIGSAMVGLEAQLYTRLDWYRTQVALL